jgi:hypothetical protein
MNDTTTAFETVRTTGRTRNPGENDRSHKDSTPTTEPTTRERWIAYHVAHAPKITRRQWADMLLLHYGKQETDDDDQDRGKVS